MRSVIQDAEEPRERPTSVLGRVGGNERGPRFIPLSEVADLLSISMNQAYGLVRTGDLPAIQVGGRGQWRVEQTVLEDYIQNLYAQTRQQVEQQRLERTSGAGSPQPPA